MSKLTSLPRVPWYSGARSLVPMIISSYLELSFTKGLWTEEHGRHVPTSCTYPSDTPSGGSGGGVVVGTCAVVVDLSTHDAHAYMAQVTD